MILYDNDHQVRATNLAHALNETAAAITSLNGGHNIPASTDRTLTIWGHGGPDSFADLTPAALRTIIAAWKTRNPQLTAVELITCDSRHVQDDQDSYVDKVMPLLIANNKVLVTVKTLPRGGSKATWSRLWADNSVGSDGYYFVAADTEATMLQGGQVFLDAFAQVPATTPVGQRMASAFPIAKKANDKAAMSRPLAYVSNGGTFSQLRGTVVPVTAYRQAGKVLAVPTTIG